MRRWDGAVEEYLRRCDARGLAQETIKSRRSELDRWGSWLKHRRPKVDLEKIDSDLIIRYLQMRTAFHAKATLSSVISHMRGFGEHLSREGLWAQNPLRWIRGPKLDGRARVPRRIGRDELKRLWDTASTLSQPYYRQLWIAILACLYGTGLRRGELARLNMDSWNREEGILRIDGRKTGYERMQPVSEGIWKCIEAYLPHRQNLLEKTGRLEERALLVNRFGNRVRADRISVGIHSLARRAEIPLVSVHQFRHSCASDLLEDGAGLAEVQQVLGHRSISSTVRYLSIADPQRREAIAKHPINRILAGGQDGQ